MKRFLSIICLLAIAGCSHNSNRRIVVASKNFTEQIILGELLAQAIEAKTDLQVDRRLYLGGTFVCHQALISGQIDAYVEYTGTALTSVLKEKPNSDPKAVYNRVQQAYNQQYQMEWTPPLGFNNTFAMIVRSEDAKALNIQTLSQAAKFTPKWRAAFGFEFSERPDGFPGLAKTYGIKLAQPPLVMDLGLMYQSIKQKQVDLVAGNSTDGLIDSLNLVVLEDDKNYFPPYEAAPVVRQEALAQHPELRQALQQLGGLISEKEMRRLNYLVDGERRDVKQVVREFLRSQGLSKNSNKYSSAK